MWHVNILINNPWRFFSVFHVNMSDDDGVCLSPGYGAMFLCVPLFKTDVPEAETRATSVSMPIYLWLHGEVPRDGYFNIYRLITAYFMCTPFFLFCQFVRLPLLSPTFRPLPRLWFISPLSLSTSLIFVSPSSRLICSPHFWAFYDST